MKSISKQVPRRLNKTIKESEEQLRVVFEGAMDGFLLADVETKRFSLSNPQMCRMLGYNADELKHLTVSDIHPPEDLPWIKEMFARQASGKITVAPEVPLRRKDGTVFYADINARSLAVDGRQCLLGIFRDNTERKQAKEALQRSEQIYRAAIEAAHAVPYTRNFRTNCYEFMGAGIEAMTGYAPSECAPEMGDNVIEEVVMPGGESFRKLSEAERKFWAGSRTTWSAEYRIRRRDGRKCWISDAAVGERDSRGRLIRSIGLLLDITERKRAEEALRTLNETLEQQVAKRTAEAEERARELNEAQRVAHVGSWTWNPETDYVTWTEELYHIFGRDPNLPAPRYREHAQIFTAESLAREDAALKHALQAGMPYEIELEFIHTNGSRRWVSERGEAVRAAAGRIVMLRGTGQDITGRKQAEEKLRESEEQYRTLVDNLNVGVCRTTLDGYYRHANPALARIHGFDSVDEFMKVWIPDLCENPADRQVLIAEILRAGSVTAYELRVKKKDGTPICCSITARAHRGADGKVDWFDNIVEDITERKRMETALRASEASFRQVIESSPIPLSVDGRDGRIEYLNRKFIEVFGYTREELFTRTDWFVRAYPNLEYRQTVARQWEAALTKASVEGKPIGPVEVEVTCKDGSLRTVEFMGTIIDHRLVIAANDRTERKKAEAALRESEATALARADELATVLTTTPASIFIAHDPDCRRISGNRAGMRLLRLPDDANASMSAPPRERPKTFRFVKDGRELRSEELPIQLATATGQMVENFEMRVALIDGTMLDIIGAAVPLYDAEGKVRGAVSSFLDITDRNRLEKQLLEVSEREQQRIGRDLHDGLCHHLAGVGFMCKALAQKLAASSKTGAADARTLANLIRQAIADARGIASGLYPVKMEAHGSMSALQELAANIEAMFHVQCVYSCDRPVIIKDNGVAVHLYRIAQEAVTNAIRHGKARHIRIGLAETDHRIKLTVKDDGKGLPDPLPSTRGIGIDIMNYRARMIGGTLDIHRAPKGGTILTCSFSKKTTA